MLAPNFCELDGAHEGDDQADQEVDQGDDGEGIRPALLQHAEDVAPLEDCRAAQEATEGQGGLAQEPSRLSRSLPGVLRGGADARQPRSGRCRAGGAGLGHRGRESEEALQSIGQALGLDRDLPRPGERRDAIEHRQSRAVPGGEPGGVVGDRAGRRSGGELLLDRRRRREPGAQMPLPGELHHQGVAVAARVQRRRRWRDRSRGPNGHVARLTPIVSVALNAVPRRGRARPRARSQSPRARGSPRRSWRARAPGRAPRRPGGRWPA